jgi:hypothetical protein
MPDRYDALAEKLIVVTRGDNGRGGHPWLVGLDPGDYGVFDVAQDKQHADAIAENTRRELAARMREEFGP